MNVTEHLLTTLSEELNELIFEALAMQKAVHKALRFGLDDTWRDTEYEGSPRELIYKELQDLLGVTELLSELEILPALLVNRDMIDAKKDKVTQFGFDYARRQGCLE